MTNETDYIIIERYNLISQQLTIYAGIILYILCLLGTIMNIVTFSQQTYTRRAASFYLLYASLFDLAHLTLGLVSNILQFGFHYDWTMNSIILCKIKYYFVYVFTIISGTLTVLASIDRFFLSSNNSKRWNYSSRFVAKRCITFTIIFWFISSIPMIFCSKRYYHLYNNVQIICTNPSEDRFCLSVRVIYTCLLGGFVPPLVMMIFCLITYFNVRHLYRRSRSKSFSTRRVNHQITSMLILQSIKSTFASLPFSIFNTYWLMTMRNEKSLLYQAKENLVKHIVYLLFWSNYTSFLVYLYSSDIFRNQWIKIMKTFIYCRYGNRRRRYYYNAELNRLKTTEL